MIRSGDMLPHEIEGESFAILTRELGGRTFSPEEEPVIKRVIHTTADFDYADNLYFSPGAVELARAALAAGATIITDTQMARSGINKKAVALHGGQVLCFMDDEEVARTAKEGGTTRAVASVNRAAALWPDGIFVVGNAPTALLRICELAERGELAPRLVVGVPVGFVNVVESKERLIQSGLPCIVARGRKGGSNVAAAICNALLYTLGDRG